MTLNHAFDASIPPGKPLPGADAAFGYIGGMTPHVWTLQEWLDATSNGALRCLPIWVADFSATPGAQAQKAAEAAVDLGWLAHADQHQSVLRAIVLDSEVSENTLFIRDFAESLLQQGFITVDYRSLAALQAAPSGLTEWVAHWNVPPGPFTKLQVAFQYKADVPFDNTQIDLDVFDQSLWL